MRKLIIDDLGGRGIAYKRQICIAYNRAICIVYTAIMALAHNHV